MKPAVFWPLVLAIPAPLLIVYFFGLWQVEQYRYFVPLFLALVFLFVGRWDGKFRLPKTLWARTLLGLGLVLVPASAILWSPWLAYLGFVFLLGSFFSSHCEPSGTHIPEPFSGCTLLYLWAPTWLCLRIPLNYDQTIIVWLQHTTSKVASVLLDLVNIPHQLTGVVFHLVHGTLFVEEACSGVQSLFAILCCSLLLLAWNRRPMALIPVYLLLGLLSAGLMNTLRIVTIGVAQERWNVDLAHGLAHDALGYTCLTLALLLIASFDRLNRVAFFPLPRWQEGFDAMKNPFESLWNLLLSPPVKVLSPPISSQETLKSQWWIRGLGGLAVLTLSTQLVFGVQFALRERAPSMIPRVGGDTAFWLPPQSLFDNVSGLKVTGYQSAHDGSDLSLGRYADVWSAKPEGMRAELRIAISQPYDEFHDLCICYTGNGSEMKERDYVEQVKDVDITAWPMMHAGYSNNNGALSDLTFSSLDRMGQPVKPERDPSLSDTFKQRFSLGSSNGSSGNEVLMFQIWAVTDVPFTSDEKLRLQQLHLQLRDVIRERMQASVASPGATQQ